MSRFAEVRRRLLTEPPRPDSVRSRTNAHWLVVATVCVGAGMGQLDASIVSLGLPSLQRAFGASLSEVEWVALTYLLVLVASVAAVGRLADMYGRKLLYTYGFAVFTAASVACGLAPTLPALILCRGLQALGAAMLQANSVALIAHAMPPEKLGRGIGVQGAAQAVGLALGPTVGGALIALGGWRLIFLVNAPLGIAGIILGWLLLPRSTELAPRVRFDLTGLVLFLPTIGCMLAALSLGTREGFASPSVVVLFAGAAALGALFVRQERRTAAPMIDPSLFASAPFTAGISSGLLAYMALFGVLFVTPFFLEGVDHLGAARTGLTLTILPVAIAVVAPVAGRLADRHGARLPTVVGMMAAAVALLLAAVAAPGSHLHIAALGLVGIGLGAFIPANNSAIMASSPRRHAGVAGGVLNMTRGIGTALGVAVTTSVFALAEGPGAGGAAATARGFSAAALMLAAVCGAAAAIAGLGRGLQPHQAQPGSRGEWTGAVGS